MRRLLLSATLIAPATLSAKDFEPDPGTAGLLSLLFPGVGEWYNRNWNSPIPIGEFCVGEICPCVRWSSVVDAAHSISDTRIRMVFWSDPEDMSSPPD